MKKINAALALIFLSANLYANSVNDMNKRLKNIDKEIEKKNTRIKNINIETVKIEKMIKDLEEEIQKNEKERENIEEEISVVKKNIDYGGKNLEISEVEHDRKESEFIAKRENLRRSDAKKEEQKKLKEKLQVEKKDHESSIVKLKKEKERISREIERIIRENARRAAERAARLKREQEEKNKKSSSKKDSGKTSSKVVVEDLPKISNSEAYRKVGKGHKPINGEIVVYFGQKKAGVVESNGIEIKGKLGAQVVASKSGTVIYAAPFQGLGKVVMIDYGSGIIGVYGNLLAVKVGLNSEVSAGQQIGILGYSSEKEPNLYYELRVNLKPIDPLPTF